MGYEVHVVRRNDFDNYEEESNISIQEWKQLVDTFPELTWEQFEGDTKVLDYEYSYWLAHPEIDESNRPWFQYYKGTICTKWADPACLKLLLMMAEHLNARLVGDEGEQYTMKEINRLEANSKSRSSSTATNKNKKPFWKFW
ncbi:MAG: hypothetical protein PSX81_01775 [bacterium]|nr:hypothetical protein [bacterium]